VHLVYLRAQETTAEVIDWVEHLLQPSVVRNCLYLAMTEFEELKDLDLALCSRLQSRLVWYFGQKDDWVTHHHAADIADACPRSEVLNCEKVRRALACDVMVIRREASRLDSTREDSPLMLSYFSHCAIGAVPRLCAPPERDNGRGHVQVDVTVDAGQ
jgi:hypothetical protein